MTDPCPRGAPPRIPPPQVAFSPPVYGIRRAPCQPVLDGVIQKPFWDAAPFTDLFQDIEGPSRPSPRFATRAKMLWDDEALYIAAELSGDEIWATLTRRDAIIFADNDFEVFIEPDSDTHMYMELEMNALNAVWDLFLPKPYRDGGAAVDSFDIKGLRTAVHIRGELNRPSARNQGWSVELALPFPSLMEATRRSGPPRAGEFWRVNFSRVQWKTDVVDGRYVKRLGADGNPLPEDNWVWSPTGVVNIHYPELWGYAFFLGADERETPAIPPQELVKWRLRRAYYAQHAYRDNHGAFCPDVAKALYEAGMDPDPEITMEVTSHGFEASCPCRDEVFALFTDGRVAAYPLTGSSR